MSSTDNTIAIIAGGGQLPLELARACQQAGRKVFVFAVSEYADDFPDSIPQARASIGKIGLCIKTLKQHHCRELVFVGSIARPKDRNIRVRPDFKAIVFLIRNFGVLTRSNDGIHRAFANLFESEGFRVVSPLSAAPNLAAQAGCITVSHPEPGVEAQFSAALAAAKAHGRTAQGQAIIYGGGRVVATETRAGTDAMLRAVQASAGEPLFLVKALSPEQLETMDPPAIGIDTVRLAAEAGLAGILVEAKRSIIVHPDRVKDLADKAGLFVCGAQAE